MPPHGRGHTAIIGRVAQMPREVSTTTEDGCPRCLAFGHLGEYLQSPNPPRIFFPQKPQQNRVSSPCAPKNSPNQRSINHFPQKNSWHSRYTPLGRINIWIEFIQPARVVSPDASRTESIFWRKPIQNQCFVGVTRAKTAFSAITRILAVFYPQVPCNLYLARLSPHNRMIPNHLLINYLLSISCL